MNYCLKANNASKLDKTLRVVYLEKVPYDVKVVEENNGKLSYEVWVDTTEEVFNKINSSIAIFCS